MTDSATTLFHDRLAGFANVFVARLPAGDRPLEVAALHGRAMLDELLDRFAGDRGSVDRRATASQWSRYFFSALLVPITVLQLGKDRAIDFSRVDLRVALNADATPCRFALGNIDDAGRGEGADFSSLLDDGLAPIIAALVACSGLAARVFWSNAAVYYDWALGELVAQGRLGLNQRARAMAWLEQPLRDTGERNPLYAPYKRCPAGARDGNAMPVTHCRRLCCVQDLDPQWGLCASCPRAIRVPDDMRATSRKPKARFITAGEAAT